MGRVCPSSIRAAMHKNNYTFFIRNIGNYIIFSRRHIIYIIGLLGILQYLASGVSINLREKKNNANVMIIVFRLK